MNDFPYPGLRPFKREETDIFFGREQNTKQLLKKLDQSHFLAVIGPSGCGKSSLVRTGLLSFLVNIVDWKVVEMRPSNCPFANLAKALFEEPILKEIYTDKYSEDKIAVTSLHASLLKGPFSLHEILQETSFPQETNLLLLIDQFEEIFRYYEEQYGVNEATAFVDLLLTSCQKLCSPRQTGVERKIYVIITMRSEYIGDCALFQGLPEAVNHGLFLTPRLNRDQLRDVIEGPAIVFDGKVEAALVNRLLNEMRDDSDQLPVLQHALMRMWDKAKSENNENQEKNITLTLKHYKEIGSLADALSQHVDDIYNSLADDQKKIAEILFRNLSEYKNDTYVRRPVILEEVAKLADVSWEEVKKVADAFREGTEGEERNFLTPLLGKDLEFDTVLDISHESLIRQWKRLKEWAIDEASKAKIYKNLEEDAQRWHSKGKRKDDLWTGTKLENGTKWHKSQPTKEWAKRYGGNFELAIEFLKVSSEKKRRQQKFQKIKILLTTVFIGFVIVSIWAFIQLDIVSQAKKYLKFDSSVSSAISSARNENYAQAQVKLAQTYELDQNVSPSHRYARNWLAWFIDMMGSGISSEQTYEGANALLFPVAVSPDGHLLATGGTGGTLVLFDVQSGKLLYHLQGHSSEDNVFAIVFHPQGKWLASAGSDKKIIFWSLDGKKIKEWPVNNPIYALAISSDGNVLASGENNQIILRNTETKEEIRHLKQHEEQISFGGLVFSPTDSWLVSASKDNTVRLWDWKEKHEPMQMIFINNPTSLAFSANGQYFAVSDGLPQSVIHIFSIDNGKAQKKIELRGHTRKISGVRFIHNDDYLVSSGYNRSIRVWDSKSGQAVQVLKGHAGALTTLANYKKQIFSASADGIIKRWSVSSFPYRHRIDLPVAAISSEITPDNQYVVVGLEDGRLQVYKLPSTNNKQPFKEEGYIDEEKGHASKVIGLVFNRDGTLLASSSLDKTVKLWRFGNGQLQEQLWLSNKIESERPVTLSPNAKFLATASDQQICLFVVKTGKQLDCNDKTHSKAVKSITFDNSSTRLFSSDDNGQTILWKISEIPAQLIPQQPYFLQQQNSVRAIAVSPDDQKIAMVVYGNHEVSIHQIQNRKAVQHLQGHESTIFSAIFSPKGQQLITVGYDATVRVWNVNNESELLTIQLPITNDNLSPYLSFDFRCGHQGDCWIAVPLPSKQLMLYHTDKIYSSLD
jgi:WD40 repeat protein